MCFGDSQVIRHNNNLGLSVSLFLPETLGLWGQIDQLVIVRMPNAKNFLTLSVSCCEVSLDLLLKFWFLSWWLSLPMQTTQFFCL